MGMAKVVTAAGLAGVLMVRTAQPIKTQLTVTSKTARFDWSKTERMAAKTSKRGQPLTDIGAG